MTDGYQSYNAAPKGSFYLTHMDIFKTKNGQKLCRLVNWAPEILDPIMQNKSILRPQNTCYKCEICK